MMGKWKYHVALQCCTLLYGSTALVGKVFSESMATLVFGRGLLAVILLYCFLRFIKREIVFQFTTKKFIQLFLMGCLLGVHWWSFFIGVQKGGVAVGALGFASFPAFIILLEVIFYKSKVSWLDGLVLLMVIIGLTMITPDFNWHADGTVGLVYGVLSGLFYAILMMLNRQWAMEVDVVRSSLVQFLGLTCLFFPFGLSGMLHLSQNNMLALLFMGIFCTGIAYNFYILGMRGTSTRIASVVLALEPVYAIVMACFYFGTWPSAVIVCGALFIVCAVVISSLKSEKITVSTDDMTDRSSVPVKSSSA